MATLLTLLFVGLVALVAAGVVLAVAGAVVSAALTLAAFLLFKVAPVVLVGYLLIRFLAPRSRRLTDEDRRWLEDGT